MKEPKARGKIVRKYEENIFGNPKFDRLLKRKMESRRGPRKRTRRLSEFGRQLMEKQKLKFIYGLTERQFRNLFDDAKRMDGVTGHNFLSLLERRLDNTVYQSGMATTRRQARQLVSHGHFLLNGRRVTVPSIVIKKDDQITARSRKATAELVRGQLSRNSEHVIPGWITVVADTLSAQVVSVPKMEDIQVNVEEQLIVEYYSR